MASPAAAVESIANFAASGIAGILWTAISPTAAWTYLAGLDAPALIGMLTTRTIRPSDR